MPTGGCKEANSPSIVEPISDENLGVMTLWRTLDQILVCFARSLGLFV